MSQITLSTLDWTVIGVYLALVLGIALRVRLGQNTSADYFLAGRSMPWVVVAISLYATLFSTISFVAVPGEAFKNGVLLSLNSIGYAVFTPLAVFLFLRFFYQTDTFTCYEYLERRFGGATRTLGSLLFLATRTLYAATAFYAAAVIFEALIGWDKTTSVLAAGVFAIVYTTIGGLRAVMITDVLQTAILLTGLAAVFYKAGSLIGFDFGAVWDYARQQGHGFGRVGEPGFYSLNPYVRYTLWIWLMGAFMGPSVGYGADQLVVQRLLASRSYAAAKRAVWLKTLGVLPIMAAFYAVGLMLFYHYRAADALPEGFEPDHVMGLFIIQHLPPPMPGLIAAALLAALMSTVDSTVNSLSTVTTMDLLKRLGWLPEDETKHIRTGKLLTLGWGVVVVGFAVFLTRASEGVESTVMELTLMWTSLWGVLLVIMLAGVLTRWATARAATVALLAGMALNLTLPWFLYYGTPAEDRISFAWVGLPGLLAAAVLVVAGSLLDPRKPAGLDGLTLASALGRKPRPD